LREYIHATTTLSDEIDEEMKNTGMTFVSSVNSVQLIWITREANRIDALWPQLNQLYEEMIESWGSDATQLFVDIRVHVTGNDESIRKLERNIACTSLYAAGALKVGRPDLQSLVEEQFRRRLSSKYNPSGLRATSTYIGFCGRPTMGAILAMAVVDTQAVAYATKNKYHTMNFYQQTHGIEVDRAKGQLPIPSLAKNDEKAKDRGFELTELFAEAENFSGSFYKNDDQDSAPREEISTNNVTKSSHQI
jgi:hypothetical protein